MAPSLGGAVGGTTGAGVGGRTGAGVGGGTGGAVGVGGTATGMRPPPPGVGVLVGVIGAGVVGMDGAAIHDPNAAPHGGNTQLSAQDGMLRQSASLEQLQVPILDSTGGLVGAGGGGEGAVGGVTTSPPVHEPPPIHHVNVHVVPGQVGVPGQSLSDQQKQLDDRALGILNMRSSEDTSKARWFRIFQ